MRRLESMSHYYARILHTNFTQLFCYNSHACMRDSVRNVRREVTMDAERSVTAQAGLAKDRTTSSPQCSTKQSCAAVNADDCALS